VPAPPKYFNELRERAVRLVFQIRRESGRTQGVIPEVARKLGIGDQSLRTWVKQAEIDNNERPWCTPRLSPMCSRGVLSAGGRRIR